LVVKQINEDKFEIIFKESVCRYKAGTPCLKLFGSLNKEEAINILKQLKIPEKQLELIRVA